MAVVGATRTTANGCQADGEAGSIGSAADMGCGVMNFFTDHATAAEWLAGHPEVTGEVLPRRRALRLGITLFGHLLDA